MTSLKQISLFTEDKLIYSQEDSLANHTQVQESDLAKKMKDTSGRTCLEQFKKFNRVGLWAKMYADLLIGMEGWYSMKCKLTWKLKATKSHRFYFQLAPSMLPIEETGFGLLPTVKAFDGMAEGANTGKTLMKTQTGYVNMDKNNVRWGASLNDLARNQILPTPTASDKNAGRRGNAPRENHNPMTNSLKDAVNYLEQTSKCSHLNPLFVEEMMGFPKNWTASPFQNGGKNLSKPTEMQ